MPIFQQIIYSSLHYPANMCPNPFSRNGLEEQITKISGFALSLSNDEAALLLSEISKVIGRTPPSRGRSLQDDAWDIAMGFTKQQAQPVEDYIISNYGQRYEEWQHKMASINGTVQEGESIDWKSYDCLRYG